MHQPQELAPTPPPPRKFNPVSATANLDVYMLNMDKLALDASHTQKTKVEQVSVLR